MKLNRVVVVYKKPSAIRGAAVGAKLGRLKRMSPDLYRRTVIQKRSHLSAIAQVQRALEELHIPHMTVLRDRLKGGLKTDLIITVGGDGTVLAASHIAGGTPILGVNSMPKTSVGFFCAATAQSFRQKISSIRRALLKPASLPLIEVSIDGKKLPYLALNDILFASASPAETVQYTIKVGSRKERQRGSGVWVAAGPGSTAGISSAGGKMTDITSRRLQYLARELYPIPGVRYKMKRGFVPQGKHILIQSEMSQGIAFLDGAKLAYTVHKGSVLKIGISPRRAHIFLPFVRGGKEG